MNLITRHGSHKMSNVLWRGVSGSSPDTLVACVASCTDNTCIPVLSFLNRFVLVVKFKLLIPKNNDI